MKKWWFILVIFMLFLVPTIFADPFKDEIKKITFYAQEYESGNINYPQFLVYSNSINGKIDEVIGNAFLNGTSEQDELRRVLGDPTEEIKYVWGNFNDRKKLDNPMPAWKKIIFDGQKIQIIFNANPNYDSYNNKIIYRPGIEVRFKSPKIELNLNDKINNVVLLAQDYLSNPDDKSSESLAQNTADIEKNFREYYQENPGNCENLMKDIFGFENEGEVQKIIIDEYEVATIEDNSLIARVERCDDCENPFINVMFKLNLLDNNVDLKYSPKEENYEDKPLDYFPGAIKETLDESKRLFLEKNYQGSNDLNERLKRLTEFWRQKSSNMGYLNNELKNKAEQQMQQQNIQRDFYYGIKQGILMRNLQKQTQKENYEKIKQLFTDYFSGLDKTTSYYSQINFRKVLLRNVKVYGNEICDNNIDDNFDGQIDCMDPACGGKLCGTETETSNSSILKNLYCIENICQARKQIEQQITICGNNICEPGERGNCTQDCPICPSYASLNCSGKVIFSGKDENDCPLKPVCIEEQITCNSNLDCSQPLCGKAECIENTCKTTSLEDCKTAECIEGDEKYQECNSEKILSEKCLEGFWKKTGIECESSSLNNQSSPIQEIEISRGNECNVKEDCNGEDYICSNGKCIMVPKNSNDENIINIPLPDLTTQSPSDSNTSSSNDNQLTGKVIFNFIQSFIRISGYAINDPEDNSTQTLPEDNSDNLQDNSTQENNPSSNNSNYEADPSNNNNNNNPDMKNFKQEDQVRKDQERMNNERKMNDCKARCTGDCENKVVIPCVNTCVFKENGEQGDLDICKTECESKYKQEAENCNTNCYNSCLSGNNLDNKADNFKKEKNEVFALTGICRIPSFKSLTKDENNFADLRFQGEGESFKNYENYKAKYNSWDGGIMWRTREYQQLIQQRKEFEKGFNQDFAKWFFEKYLPNSATEWDSASEGINQIYNQDQKNIMEISRHLSALGLKEFPAYNLINISYKSDYGELEFWEEMKNVKLNSIYKESSNEFNNQEYSIVSPYMKLWVFPQKDFIKTTLKTMMNTHQLPGAAKDRNLGGTEGTLPEEQKSALRQDPNFMKSISAISNKYNGDMNGVIQIKDSSNEEIIFNVLLNINEKDIFKLKPLPPEEVKKQDIKLTFDFDKIYSFVYTTQKEIESNKIYTPEWDKSSNFGQKITETVDNVKIFFKISDLIGSAKIEPRKARGDVNLIVKTFVGSLLKNSGNNNNNNTQLDNKNNNLNNINKDK